MSKKAKKAEKVTGPGRPDATTSTRPEGSRGSDAASGPRPKTKNKEYSGRCGSCRVFLNVSLAEQTRRLENRIDDPRKLWKLSPTDLKSYSRRYAYLRARDAMFAATDTSWAPWWVVDNDDKKRGRLNIIRHLLQHVPCELLAPQDVKMPRPPSPREYEEPDLPLHSIPTPF